FRDKYGALRGRCKSEHLTLGVKKGTRVLLIGDLCRLLCASLSFLHDLGLLGFGVVLVEVARISGFKNGVILVKFGKIDRTRILNLTLWLFDQSLFAMFPFVKGQELDDYVFNIMPFWIRIYNTPFEKMDRKVSIDMGKAIGEVVAID
ncbi:hypothetical protein Gorai_019420, partial [Gossypium raimondii]|nr:hypothetical protein [Gossypium raimondii]